jgi:hypothetical protein
MTYYYHFSNIKAVIVARGHLRWIYPILGFVACGLVFLSLSRLALSLWQLECFMLFGAKNGTYL